MIRGLLLDLEGVLYESGHSIAGAADAVRELADAGLRIRYLTNTTTRSRRAIVERLRSMGVFVDPRHLFTPSAAACRLLERDGIRRLHLAAPSALCEDFAVFELVEADPEAVVMGDLHEGFTWHRLNQLFQMLRSRARLVALHRNRYFGARAGSRSTLVLSSPRSNTLPTSGQTSSANRDARSSTWRSMISVSTRTKW
jgi:ribonucleotide monophosphatase NagD (HAD superfamily)